MDRIEHNYIEVNGLKLHVAEIGSGSSVVVFLHGFPEIWYSWRHQMIAVANAGFRAIAPDYRGYGLSDPSAEPEKTAFFDFVTDLLAVLDALSISKVSEKYFGWTSISSSIFSPNVIGFRDQKRFEGYNKQYESRAAEVFLIGKDFGAMVAYLFALLHPERVSGVVTLGVPFMPPDPPAHHKILPEGFYTLRWREPGRAEADFGRFDVKTVVRNIYILFSKSEIPIAAENQEIMDLVEPSTPLPSWFTEEDLAIYGALYEKSGFRTALQVPYRSFGERSNAPGGPDPKVEAPALFIMGEKDYVFKFPGMEEYVRSGKVKVFVPNLEIKFLPEGSHFVQEQFPDQVNQLLLTFLNNNS